MHHQAVIEFNRSTCALNEFPVSPVMAGLNIDFRLTWCLVCGSSVAQISVIPSAVFVINSLV